MDSQTVSGWLGLLSTVPIGLWAFAAAFVVGALLPWMVEFGVPLTEWSNNRFRVITWGLAIVLGTAAAVTIWPHPVTVTLGWVAALVAQVAREVLARKYPWLSPRQSLIVKRDAAGNVVGIKDGDNPTVFVAPPTPPVGGGGTGQKGQSP